MPSPRLVDLLQHGIVRGAIRTDRCVSTAARLVTSAFTQAASQTMLRLSTLESPTGKCSMSFSPTPKRDVGIGKPKMVFPSQSTRWGRMIN